MEISRNVVIDLTVNDILNHMAMLQQQRGLASTDMELVATKVLAEARAVKNYDYARQIVDLSQKIQQLEKEGNNDKPNNQFESNS